MDAVRGTPETPNGGTVRFEPIGADLTLVNLTMEYEPKGAVENIGDALGALNRRGEVRRLLHIVTLVQQLRANLGPSS